MEVFSEKELRRAVRKLNARAWGISVGLMAAIGLFVATNVLVLRGGETVGPHLALLGNFFPGYSVTVVGSFVGFVYAFVVGYGLGRLLSWIYNRQVADFPGGA